MKKTEGRTESRRTRRSHNQLSSGGGKQERRRERRPEIRARFFGWRPQSRCPDTEITPLAAAAPEDGGMRGRRGAWEGGREGERREGGQETFRGL